VKKLPVSTTTKPVKHTALVEVNNASINEIPEFAALGSINTNEPITMMIKKLKTNNCAGLIRPLLKLNFNAEISRRKTKIIAIYKYAGLLKTRNNLKYSN
jgi:hypothetical protein